MPERSLRLSNGPGLGGRIVGAVVGALFAAGGLLFAATAVAGGRFLGGSGGPDRCVDPAGLGGLPADAVPPDVAVCSAWLPGQLGTFAVVGLVMGGGVALFGLVFAARSVRVAARLEGTVLRARGLFRYRAVDLATAQVTVGTVTHTTDGNRHHRVPVLVARDPASGRRVRLSLNGGGLDRLPPAELRALADAVTAGRPVSQADAWQVASHLRQLADNPLDLPVR